MVSSARSRGTSRDRSREDAVEETFVDSVFARGPRGRTRDSPGGTLERSSRHEHGVGRRNCPTRSPACRLPADSAHGPPRRAMRRRRRLDPPRRRSSGAARAWPRGSPERARETRRERRRSFAARASQSPGSTIVPPRDRAWTRLARRFVRRRESSVPSARGACQAARGVGPGMDFAIRGDREKRGSRNPTKCRFARTSD